MKIKCKKCGHQFHAEDKKPQTIQYRQVRQIFSLDQVGAAPKCPSCSALQTFSKRKKDRELKPIEGTSAKTVMVDPKKLQQDACEPTARFSAEKTEPDITEPILDVAKPGSETKRALSTEAHEPKPLDLLLDEVSEVLMAEPSVKWVESESKSERCLSPEEPLQPFEDSKSETTKNHISFLLFLIVGASIFVGMREWQVSKPEHFDPAVVEEVQQAAVVAPVTSTVDRPQDLSQTLSPDLRAYESEIVKDSWLAFVQHHMKDQEENRLLLPRSARLSSDFGYRVDPFSKAWRFHHGLDIAVKQGEAIKSFMPGKVTFSGYKGHFGRVVFVEHAHGLIAIYGHLKKTLVKKGDTVKRGDVVGLSGMTGRSTGPHLHFELRLGKKKIDPNLLEEFAFLIKKKRRKR